MCAAYGLKRRSPNVRRGHEELLQKLEKAHKEDIMMYSSGHLSLYSLLQRDPLKSTAKPAWEASLPSVRRSTMSRYTGQVQSEAAVGKMDDAVTNIGVETVLLSKSRMGQGQREGQVDSLFRGIPEKQLPQLQSLKPGEDQDHLTGVTWRENLKTWMGSEQLVLRKQDLRDRRWICWSKVVERHERKLDQELRKLSVDNVPSRGRLHVFSRVFHNLCQESQVFGDILKEIKAEYDLYVTSILESQAELHNVPTEFFEEGLDSGIMGKEDLEEARMEVSRLEKAAWEVLEENERVRRELQRVLEQSEDKEVCTGLTQPADAGKQGEGPSSSVDQIQLTRHQVWNVWEEVQKMEKEIKEKMVSLVTTDATEQSIGDSQTEIIKLLASNEHLQNSNKDFASSINEVFGRAKVTDELKRQLWDNIWTVLRREDDTENKTVNQ